jgi:hypothetical protein
MITQHANKVIVYVAVYIKHNITNVKKSYIIIDKTVSCLFQ